MAILKGDVAEVTTIIIGQQGTTTGNYFTGNYFTLKFTCY